MLRGAITLRKTKQSAQKKRKGMKTHTDTTTTIIKATTNPVNILLLRTLFLGQTIMLIPEYLFLLSSNHFMILSIYIWIICHSIGCCGGRSAFILFSICMFLFRFFHRFPLSLSRSRFYRSVIQKAIPVSYILSCCCTRPMMTAQYIVIVV